MCVRLSAERAPARRHANPLRSTGTVQAASDKSINGRTPKTSSQRDLAPDPASSAVGAWIKQVRRGADYTKISTGGWEPCCKPLRTRARPGLGTGASWGSSPRPVKVGGTGRFRQAATSRKPGNPGYHGTGGRRPQRRLAPQCPGKRTGNMERRPVRTPRWRGKSLRWLPAAGK